MYNVNKYRVSRDTHPSRMPLREFATTAIVALILSLLSLQASAVAQTPQEKGLAIAMQANERNEGFGDFTAEMTMLLIDRQGRTSERHMRFQVLEVERDGDKSLFVFDQPRDVQGTALLTHAHINTQDDQWLYLPALKRVKRISAATRSGSFMGSEFSYEDMSTQEVEEYTYTYLHDEPCGALTCTVSEQVPSDEKSGYSRKVAWQDTEEFRTWKIEHYDRKNELLKTLTFAGYQQYRGKFWRAGEMTMVNHLTGKRTVLNWQNFVFSAGLDDNAFTQTALRRVR